MTDPSGHEEPPSVASFFDSLSSGYDAAIERCVPRYREMLSVLLEYLPPDLAPHTIVELGCGTGNLSEVLARSFPNSTLHLTDISAASLDMCRTRLEKNTARCVFHTADFRELEFAVGSTDLVISSISLHHLRSPEKADLFRKVYGWLGESGVFSFSDQFAGATPDIYARHMRLWEAAARDLGATQTDWSEWMRHQSQDDHHDSLTDQIGWLKNAGFSTIDCPWRFLLWTVLQARK